MNSAVHLGRNSSSLVGALREDFRQVSTIYFLPIVSIVKAFGMAVKLARAYSRNSLHNNRDLPKEAGVKASARVRRQAGAPYPS